MNDPNPLYEEIGRLRASHAELLAACINALSALWPTEPATSSDGCYSDDPLEKRLRAAIANAEKVRI
jgi:hypothetical protein